MTKKNVPNNNDSNDQYKTDVASYVRNNSTGNNCLWPELSTKQRHINPGIVSDHYNQC